MFSTSFLLLNKNRREESEVDTSIPVHLVAPPLVKVFRYAAIPK